MKGKIKRETVIYFRCAFSFVLLIFIFYVFYFQNFNILLTDQKPYSSGNHSKYYGENALGYFLAVGTLT